MKLDIKNKYLFSWIIASFIISTVLYAVSLGLSWYGTFGIGLFLYVPVLIVTLIYFIGIKTGNKFPKSTKIIANILNVIIVVFFQLFICGLFTLFVSGLFEREVTNIIDYKHALSSIGPKDRIAHFPQKIPKNVTNIELYRTQNNWFGNGEIYLTFISDKSYIDNELSKYDFEVIEGPFEDYWDYYFAASYIGLNNLKTIDFKHYVIKTAGENQKAFSYGILVKEDTNQIVYYYDY